MVGWGWGRRWINLHVIVIVLIWIKAEPVHPLRKKLATQNHIVNYKNDCPAVF